MLMQSKVVNNAVAVPLQAFHETIMASSPAHQDPLIELKIYGL